MEKLSLTHLLETNAYPGRGIVLGRSADNQYASADNQYALRAIFSICLLGQHPQSP